MNLRDVSCECMYLIDVPKGTVQWWDFEMMIMMHHNCQLSNEILIQYGHLVDSATVRTVLLLKAGFCPRKNNRN
jgi:hypothetical protein